MLWYARGLVGILTLAILMSCSPPPSTQPDAARPPVTIDQWLTYLTPEEKVGQLIWFGLQGITPSAEAEELLRQGKVGGFIYFARQGTDPAVLRNLTGQLQRLAAGRARFSPGLLISVDHEGGQVQRFLDDFTAWPGAMAIGATRSAAYARQIGQAMAQELLSVGVNLNLAPVADVNNNPANPVIGVRSFGEDPDLVARMVAATLAGFRAEGLGGTVKHFPGHGDTNMDSHKALPTVAHGMDRLEQVELVPFRAAIAADVDAIMTAHVSFPAVATNGLPATLSPQVLQGLLKEKLGFRGVVVTDAIDTMKAITNTYGREKGLIMALQAGADAVLVTDSFGQQKELHGLLLKAVQDGLIPQARLDDAVRRTLALKHRLGLLPAPENPNRPKPASTDQHRRLALQVGADALTLVRNQHLPLKLRPDQMVLAVGPSYAAKVTGVGGVLTALGAGLKAQHDNVREVTLDRRPSPAGLAAARTLAAKAAVIVYGVANGHSYPEHQAFLQELLAAGKAVIVVGMGEPYELTAMPQIQTYIAAYGYQVPNLQGVAALLFGKAPSKGKLPVSIPGLYEFGHGLSL